MFDPLARLAACFQGRIRCIQVDQKVAQSDESHRFDTRIAAAPRGVQRLFKNVKCLGVFAVQVAQNGQIVEHGRFCKEVVLRAIILERMPVTHLSGGKIAGFEVGCSQNELDGGISSGVVLRLVKLLCL